MTHTYNYITNLSSPNYTAGRGLAIAGETGHHWGTVTLTFEGVCSWLCNPRSQVSAHYVTTGTGRRVACLVDLGNTAWHAGDWTGNASTIGIEMDPRCRDEDYDVAAELIAELWLWHGRKPIYPHKHWIATACPGNYDLARLEREVVVWYDRKIGKIPAKAAAPAIDWRKFKEPKRMEVKKDLRIRDLCTNKLVGRVVKKGEQFNFTSYAFKYGATFLREDWAEKSNLNHGMDTSYLQQPTPKKAELPGWQRNMKDIKHEKLTVLPANGTYTVNLADMKIVPDTLVPRGTQVDVVKKTTVAGKEYYMSSHAVEKGLPWGIPTAALGVPAEAPASEKPEWLKNLVDIEDKGMWTRSDTPVLNVENGEVLRTLPINTKVRVTHTTEVLGQQLLMISDKEVIETIYLNDKPVENPNDDIEKRVSALEKIVQKIVEFLTRVFKNFNK